MAGLADHFGPELLARLGVDGVQACVVGLGVEYAVAEHDGLQAALAAVDLGLGDPYAGQAAALGHGFGNNFIIQGGRQLPSRAEQAPHAATSKEYRIAVLSRVLEGGGWTRTLYYDSSNCPKKHGANKQAGTAQFQRLGGCPRTTRPILHQRFNREAV